MANLTITVDDEILRQARIHALEQRTSVNRLLAEYLEQYARREHTQQRAARGLLDLARRHRGHAGSGPGGRVWRREELHER